jgi:hypothetical protein
MMWNEGAPPTDPLIQRNPIFINGVYFPVWAEQMLPGPAYTQYGNQYDNGAPLDTPWDRYARNYDPTPEALSFGVPNVGDNSRGVPLLWPFTEMQNGFMPIFDNFSDWLAFSNPSRLIVYVDDLNYRGLSPLELQPLVNAPEPWEEYTAQQRAGGG